MVENTPLSDTADTKTLHLVVRDPNGRIEYQPIGHAIVAADIDGDTTPSALHNDLSTLALYQAHSPRQAAAAMGVLADLGDVDFEKTDFTSRLLTPSDTVNPPIP